jgi:hypothetical protein
MDFQKPKITCECGHQMKPVLIRWKRRLTKGWRCPKCKEELIRLEDAQKAFENEKIRPKKGNLKKLFGTLNIKKPTQQIMDEIDEGYD